MGRARCLPQNIRCRRAGSTLYCSAYDGEYLSELIFDDFCHCSNADILQIALNPHHFPLSLRRQLKLLPAGGSMLEELARVVLIVFIFWEEKPGGIGAGCESGLILESVEEQ